MASSPPVLSTAMLHPAVRPAMARGIGEATSCQPLSAPGDDDPILSALGGAAARGRLHAIHPARPGHEGAASGFALALLLALDAIEVPGRAFGEGKGPLLWVQDRSALSEAGAPYGPGLAAIGLDPARLLVVSTANAIAALTAVELGLESEGLAGVLVELPRRLPADMLRLGKRLALRAEARGAPCLLLHAGAEAVEAPVASRWQVASRPAERDAGDGLRLADFVPAFDLELSKNRFGPLGRWSVRWAAAPSAASSVSEPSSRSLRHDHRFSLAAPLAAAAGPPHPEPMAAVPGNRPDRARDQPPRLSAA